MRAPLFALFLLGCGHDAVQRAVVTVPMQQKTDGATPSGTSITPERTWLVTPERTRFEVRADGPLVGEQRFGFRRYRAHVATNGLEARFHATIDVQSLEGPFASVVRDRLLEASRFPEATFDGTAKREASSDACTVEGTLSIHGITKTLHFNGTVREENGDLHIRALFEVPRKEFDIAFHDSWDTFLPDDVRVLLELSDKNRK